MYEPRPAMTSARPPEIRSRVAKSWKTRTGSAVLSTVTALVSRMVRVRAAAAARIGAGAEAMKSDRWCSPTPKTSSPTASASSACSIVSRMRSAGDGPPSASGVTSPNVMMPASKAMPTTVRRIADTSTNTPVG